MAQGIALTEDCLQQTITLLDSLPDSATTSMQLDMSKGNRSELDEQIAAIVRLGEVLDIDTPVNRFVLNSLQPLELRARGELNF